jgi:hypothetical protein
MPLCISCRGEYWLPDEERPTTQPRLSAATTPTWREEFQADERREAARAALPGLEGGQEAGSRTPASDVSPLAASDLAQLYSRPEVPAFVCARCGQSNKGWHAWASQSGLVRFSRFFFHSLPWGWLALISFILPVLAAAVVDFTPVASERIGIPLSILLIFVNFALLYALKDSLWQYDHLARVGRGFKPSLTLLTVITFVLALVFGLALVFMLEARKATPQAGPTEGLVRVITTILLALTFVDVTLSALFMAGHDYGNWLNLEMPQPIYAQERRLLRVIEDSVRAKIQRVTGKDGPVEITIADLERTADAGVILMINTETQVKPNPEGEALRQLQHWRVETDRWGQIIKMSREGTPQYIAIEKVPTNGKAEAEAGKKEDGGEAEAAKEGEMVPTREGYAVESYKTRSETTISIASRRQHWME